MTLAAKAPAGAVQDLMTPEAVRSRCAEILELGLADRLPRFAVDGDRIDACADFVAAEIRRNYPSLDVPFHSRWRHFELGGHDLWAGLADARGLAGHNTDAHDVTGIGYCLFGFDLRRKIPLGDEQPARVGSHTLDQLLQREGVHFGTAPVAVDIQMSL